MPDNDTLQINHKKQINIAEYIFKKKPTSKLLLDRLPGKSFHLSFYTATLEMMVKEMGTPYNLLFPRHETPHLAAPIAAASDVKWQDKSYQRDKMRLT